MLALLLALAPQAVPQPPPTRADEAFDWSAPPGCADAAAVRSDVQRLLGGDEVDFSPVTVRGEITGGQDGPFVLDLEVSNEEGTAKRRLQSLDCATLAEAAALFVAITLDPLALLDEKPPQGVTPAEPPPPLPPKPLPPTAAPPKPRPPPRPGASVGLFGLGRGMLGLLPGGGGGGVGLGLHVTIPHLRIAAEGQYWFRRRARFDDPSEVGADIRLGIAEIDFCPFGSRGPVDFHGCAGFALGGVDARGSGVEGSSVQRGLWVGATVGPAVRWRIVRRVALWVDVGAVFSLRRPRFGVEGLGEVTRLGAVGGRLGLGLEVRLN